MAHDFSPIDSEAKYQAALEYLMTESSRMALEVLGKEMSPDTLTIFTHSDEEYSFLDRLIRTYGTKSRFTHGITLYIDTDRKIAGHHVSLLGVREPDPERPELGYADYPVDDYEAMRAAKKRHTQEITTSRGQSLLELRHPDFDIRGYIVSTEEHGSLFDELGYAVEAYHTKWHELVAGRQDKAFFERLRPTAVAWKVFDRAEFDRCSTNLRDMCDQMRFAWVNNRWLATLHLKDELLPGNIQIIKLMERRPGSSDPTGLDHVDFMIPNGVNAKAFLAKESTLKWSEETNGPHGKWLSVWFAGTEAKLRNNTVLQVCADELTEIQERILG
jgi:hypothetical protein